MGDDKNAKAWYNTAIRRAGSDDEYEDEKGVLSTGFHRTGSQRDKWNRMGIYIEVLPPLAPSGAPEKCSLKQNCLISTRHYKFVPSSAVLAVRYVPGPVCTVHPRVVREVL